MCIKQLKAEIMSESLLDRTLCAENENDFLDSSIDFHDDTTQDATDVETSYFLSGDANVLENWANIEIDAQVPQFKILKAESQHRMSPITALAMDVSKAKITSAPINSGKFN